MLLQCIFILKYQQDPLVTLISTSHSYLLPIIDEDDGKYFSQSVLKIAYMTEKLPYQETHKQLRGIEVDCGFHKQQCYNYYKFHNLLR